MRDKLIHNYFGVSLALVWDVVEKELATLEGQLALILERLGTS